MTSIQSHRLRTGVAAVALLLLGVKIGLALDPPKRFTQLLSTSETIVGEPIVYPTGAPAKITTGIVQMMPGDESGWHTHGVPLTGLILEGELTIDYGDKGKKTLQQGESIAEAISVPHNSKNTGSVPMKLFVVYIGAEGLPINVPIKK